MELEDLPLESASNSWEKGQPIVIDFGSYRTRVGMASADVPAHSFPGYSAKYRDKRTSSTQLVVGAAALAQTARSTIKPIHDAGIVANWDVVEHVLDYSFDLLGVNSNGFVDSPLVISEQMAAPHAGRATMSEIIFEGYGVPKLSTCVDALAAYSHASDNREGLGVHLGEEAVYITPFSDNKPNLSKARRLNWGGRQAGEFMQQLLALKYPLFPTRLSVTQAEQIFRKCCYVAQDYSSELSKFLAIDGLDARERIIQMPPAVGKDGPTAEQLEAQAERRRESGRKLQEQAAKAREEKMTRLNSELQVLKEIQETGNWEEQFKSEEALESAISRLKRAINPNDVEDEAPPATPLLNIPDTDLSPDELKEKRKQKLFKANYDARMKLKAEKLAKAQELEKLRAADEEWRQRDLEDWIKTKRSQLFQVRDSIREKRKLRQQLNDRRSLASKMRMKSIVLLASGEANKKRKLKDQDDFGANDDDWLVYNDVEEDEEEDDNEKLRALQQELLTHDPSFSLDEMHERIDWTKNTIHKFLYGAHPFEANSIQQAYQLNINLERIKVPEVLFQPYINGVDQAGLSQILEGVLGSCPQSEPYVCLTGGLANLSGLGDRIHRDLQAVLPWKTKITVQKGSDPSNAAWKGMASYASNAAYVTKQEYEESGFRVLKHGLGNIY